CRPGRPSCRSGDRYVRSRCPRRPVLLRYSLRCRWPFPVLRGWNVPAARADRLAGARFPVESATASYSDRAGSRIRIIDTPWTQGNPREVWENCLRIRQNPVVPACGRWFNIGRAGVSGPPPGRRPIDVLESSALLLVEGDRVMRKIFALVAVGIFVSGL